MGSLHRRERSKYFWAAFYMPDGRRAFRSTKCANRQDALQVLAAWEKAAALGRAGVLTAQQVHNVMQAIFLSANREQLPNSTARAYLLAWVGQKEPELADTSAGEYRRITGGFLDAIGKRADRPMDAIRPDDVLKWRSHLAERVGPATVNKCIKILRGAWAQAEKEGIVSRNVFQAVNTLKKPHGDSRRAFTLDELRRILEVCDTEWRGIVLMGVYTGQRMSDVVLLSWSQIDLARGEIYFNTRKTGARLTIPAAAPLREYLMGLHAGDDPRADLFPNQAAVMRSSGSAVSRAFMAILEDAGIIPKDAGHRKHASKGKGRSARRTLSEVSFHSLRHTATSLLKNAGVSDVVARSIVGHESESVSRTYTHIEGGTMREAVGRMPDVTKEAPKR